MCAQDRFVLAKLKDDAEQYDKLQVITQIVRLRFDTSKV